MSRHSPTMGEIKESLERAVNGYGTLVLRPTDSMLTMFEAQPKLVFQAWKQIERAIPLLECGAAAPEECAAEALLLQMFQNHYENT